MMRRIKAFLSPHNKQDESPKDDPPRTYTGTFEEFLTTCVKPFDYYGSLVDPRLEVNAWLRIFETRETKKCHVCGQIDEIPYRCEYCGKVSCSEHRLPEKHDCIFMSRTWEDYKDHRSKKYSRLKA